MYPYIYMHVGMLFTLSGLEHGQHTVYMYIVWSQCILFDFTCIVKLCIIVIYLNMHTQPYATYIGTLSQAIYTRAAIYHIQQVVYRAFQALFYPCV